ncbi:hypothetical protein JAAARDRAFT_53993 [Jaapia argillacea MUCL 33604]|uniref:U three protein 23 n=1 Tax=Jaapia argillacea MUCL 33604 TaxID=933084 RepID=A0A067QA02_9AGAM|nr:hypothetical protein JAAARDRAFT_53993 [Jaapia argillacea MUCL 33604]
MRQKRAKTYRKLMALYTRSFGFREPYQVLVDSEMCKAAVSNSVDLAKQLGSVVQGTVKPMITQCCIHELYLQGKSNQPAVDVAKLFERRKCNHREAIPGDECLASVVGDTNKHRYVIATLSQPLRARLRKIPGVPLIHITRAVMVLEPPSDATLESKDVAEEQALHPTAPEKAQLSSTTPADPPPPRKKKGPKAPNPLSVKKKKAKEPDTKREESRSLPRDRADEVDADPKRKRDVEDNEMLNEGDVDEVQPISASGRRRKRRRKLKAAGSGDVEVEASQ